ncbi:lactoylglutathione lyase [Psychrobacter aquaticus]|uniref:Lactoylglutathione lyase n=1 Tax=Psychrobacter aquaticus CMS 56 TaxID=1354303 RepID=U4T546_9GAMM|nr:lactoylglutathione lyase [Psychrobacter aquaticus]ERL55296.1 Lactoylglutathione lyase [Psychrobacter aquaticus CMS 56]
MSTSNANATTDTNKSLINQPASSISNEGVQPISVQTTGFTFNHTMLRVKDPVKSLAFYTGVLGMTLLAVKKFPNMGFDLYFLAKLTESERENLPAGDDLEIFAFRQRGILELTHNYGTETKADFSYHDGNQDPQGFGHICFSVPNLDEAVAWFDKNDVEFKKRPEDGSMKNIAFIKDVDGYWIEIVQADLMG